jgi:2-(1,2-epoxy-1,2-dihydrophenyl)acetyl-CoA isomerase
VSTEIKVTDEGAVRTLVLAGPARRNALSLSTVDQLHDEVLRAERDDAIGALVLTGAGDHFCAGGDADSVLTAIADDGDDATVRFMRAYHRAVTALWQSPLPVVAAVSGIAYGGGFNLALTCDLIVCARTARFCQVFLRRGVVPDLGGAYLLPRLVGMQRAKELMLLTGEVDAETAYRLGLVNVLVDTAADARAQAADLARRLAAGSRLAVSQTKRLLNASTTGTLQSSLELEAISQAAVLRSPGAQQVFEAFLAR